MHNFKLLNAFFLFLLFFYTQVNFAAGSTKDAVRFYKQGLAAMKADRCQQAKRKFNQAIALIPNDNRRLRGFGRTTIKYFPNAKLRQLKTRCRSTTQIAKTPIVKPEPKANKPTIITPKPYQPQIRLVLNLDQNNINTKKNTVKISGSVKGAKNSRLTIDGAPVRVNYGRFSLEIDAPVGYSNVTLVLADSRSKITKKIRIHRTQKIARQVSRSPSTSLKLSVDSNIFLAVGEQVTISGKISGGSRIKLWIDGRKTRIQGNRFNKTLNITNGQRRITIKASLNGQTKTKRVFIKADTNSLLLTITKPTEGYQTRDKNVIIKGYLSGGRNAILMHAGQKVSLHNGQFKQKIKLKRGENRLQFFVKDNQGRLLQKTVNVERVKPLRIVIAQGDYIISRYKKVKISGRVEGVIGVAILKIAGNAILYKEDGAFKYQLTASSKEKKIRISLKDKSKTKVEKIIRIVRE